MQRVGELMLEALREFYRVVVEWLGGLPVEFDVRQWSTLTWLIVACVALVLLLVARRPRRAPGRVRGNWPELMISHGEIVLEGAPPAAAPADGGRRKAALLTAPEGAAYQLRMTVSNLNTYPMQLLEFAVRVSGRRQPAVADANAVVPPQGAVDVVADLMDLPGEGGTFELYLHGTRSRPRTVKLVVPLEWEPWNQRYRLRATGQRVERAGTLPSSGLMRSERGRRRAARVSAAASGVSGAVGGAARRLGSELAQRRSRYLAARAARAAAARAAREAESQSLRPVPTAVPFSPGRRSEQQAPAPVGRSSLPQSAEAAGAPWRTRAPFPDSSEPAADEQDPQTDPRSLGDDEPPRRRLDFPDEF